MTPFIKLEFTNNNLTKEEFTNIFCSNIYVLNYVKTINDFIPESNKIVNEEELNNIYKKLF